MKSWQADLALLFAALLWGTTFVLIKNLLHEYPPLSFLAWRFLLAALVMCLFSYHELCQLRRPEWKAGVWLGVALILGYVSQTVGLKYTTAGKAGFITGLNMVIVPFIAALCFKSRISLSQGFSVFLAIIGLAFLCLDKRLKFSIGDLWILGSALTFAFQIVGVTYFSRRYRVLPLATIQTLTVAVLAWLIALLMESPFKTAMSVHSLLVIVYTGVMATAVTFVLQMKAQACISSTRAALLLGTEAVFAALFGWFDGETLGLKEIFGCLLIAISIIVVELRFPIRRSIQTKKSNRA